MKSLFLKAVSALALAGSLFGTPAFAVGLPVAAYKSLKLKPYVTHGGALGYTISMTGAQIDGTVASLEGFTAIVTDSEGVDYTVDMENALFLNYAGKKTKREQVNIGDRVVVDGYLARNSTGMSARRVIDAGLAKKTALE